MPNPERVGRTVERHIGANEGEALRAAIRAHRTTMHGAIGAAFLVAAREKFGLDEMTILSTVELRRMMKPPLPVTAFGCYIDILRTHHDLSDDFWAMAGDLSFKLISAIARDQESASIMKLATWEVYEARPSRPLTHRRRIDGIAITTAGEANFTGTYGPFTIEGHERHGLGRDVRPVALRRQLREGRRDRPLGRLLGRRACRTRTSRICRIGQWPR